jgi:proline dehydrogenase
MRRLLLKASENSWLREHAMHSRFLRRGVTRFMPGENVEDALRACRDLARHSVGTILTRLGENVGERAQAEAVTSHYVDVLEAIRLSDLPAEISVKLTQLGLDLDSDFCFSNLCRLLARSPAEKTLWIDMEQSSYVERTLQLFHLARRSHLHVGVCVQAYLHRTKSDVEGLIAEGAAVRLVKGAYREPPDVAFASKHDVNKNYFHLAQRLLGSEARRKGVRAALATHDRPLMNRLTAWAAFEGLSRRDVEFQMLYGIQRAEQLRLAKQGYRSRVLISYGSYWFPWFMRRLAERPANLLFLARNVLSR